MDAHGAPHSNSRIKRSPPIRTFDPWRTCAAGGPVLERVGRHERDRSEIGAALRQHPRAGLGAGLLLGRRRQRLRARGRNARARRTRDRHDRGLPVAAPRRARRARRPRPRDRRRAPRRRVATRSTTRATSPTTPDRCFHCKSELYDIAEAKRVEWGLAVTLNGTNCDDLGDYRPGLEAAKKAGVVSPLVECGFTKADVRAGSRSHRARRLGQAGRACLSSRIPYGTSVTAERLVADRRLRGRAQAPRLSPGARALPRQARADRARPRRARARRRPGDARRDRRGRQAHGFQYVTLDLGGYRMGSHNEVLVGKSLRIVRVAASRSRHASPVLRRTIQWTPSATAAKSVQVHGGKHRLDAPLCGHLGRGRQRKADQRRTRARIRLRWRWRSLASALRRDASRPTRRRLVRRRNRGASRGRCRPTRARCSRRARACPRRSSRARPPLTDCGLLRTHDLAPLEARHLDVQIALAARQRAHAQARAARPPCKPIRARSAPARSADRASASRAARPRARRARARRSPSRARCTTSR